MPFSGVPNPNVRGAITAQPPLITVVWTRFLSLIAGVAIHQESIATGLELALTPRNFIQ